MSEPSGPRQGAPSPETVATADPRGDASADRSSGAAGRRIAEAVRAQFGRQAAQYTTSPSHAAGDTLAMTVALAAPRAGERAADVATGTGHTALALAPALGAAPLLAVDLTRAMLDEARRLAAARGVRTLVPIVGAAEALPLATASLDLVTCRIAPHHFAGPARFAAEVARVLRPGGRLVVCDTASPGDPEADAWMDAVERRRDPSHVRNYTAAEWRRLVEGAGLALETLEVGRHTRLAFDDWVHRGGVTADTLAWLGDAFERAPAAARSAFDIRPDPAARFRWAWTVVLLRARKPA